MIEIITHLSCDYMHHSVWRCLQCLSVCLSVCLYMSVYGRVKVTRVRASCEPVTPGVTSLILSWCYRRQEQCLNSRTDAGKGCSQVCLSSSVISCWCWSYSLHSQWFRDGHQATQHFAQIAAEHPGAIAFMTVKRSSTWYSSAPSRHGHRRGDQVHGAHRLHRFLCVTDRRFYRRTSVFSASEDFFTRMRYINSHLTLTMTCDILLKATKRDFTLSIMV